MGLFRRQMQSTGLCRLDNCNNSERSSRRFIKTNEAPYQIIGQRTLAATFGFKELSSGHFWLSLLSESISCYLYVFIVCATRISWTGSIIGHEPNLIAMALTSGAAMMLLMLVFRTVHVNPALTIAFFLTGRIPLIRTVLYVLVHCISSVAAIALLYSISIAGHAGALGLDNPHPLLEPWQILLVEFVISFVVTMVIYTTCSYSSYTNARQFILEQVGQNCTDILDLKSTCDNIPGLNEIPNNHLRLNQDNCRVPIMSQTNIRQHHQQPQRPSTAALSSSFATAARRPTPSTNFRVHPQSKWYPSDTYENSEFEYEYDNHRIYTHQQQSSPESPATSRAPPIEDLMHLESQLLAPNGFSFLMTPCQSFIIGLAYAMTSLTGIPASGASLNPARSFGPAFFMNRWDNHWIFWLGPVLGAVVAGFLYEFIFNPTQSSSLCYLPKLFRLSAQDMAEVSSKSRLYKNKPNQHIATPPEASIFASNISHRPLQSHNFPTIHHSPTTRLQTGINLMNNATLLNPTTRDLKNQQLIAPSTSLAHLQPSHFNSNNFDQLNYIQTQQQRQQHNNQLSHDATNFDHRSKSTAIINLVTSKHQQSTINIPSRNNFHSVSSSNGSASQDFANMNGPDVMALYDNPAGQERFGPALSHQLATAAPKRLPGGFCEPNTNSMARIQQQRLGMARPVRPSSQMIGPSQQEALDAALALKRRSVATLGDGLGQGTQSKSTGSTRPLKQPQVFPNGQLVPSDKDENFYQLPSSELDETEKLVDQDGSLKFRREPPGGSTGEGSQSNSSGTTNETGGSNQTNLVGELATSAELLSQRLHNAHQIDDENQNDYYN